MTNDMTVGKPTKLIVSFIIPLLIGNIFQQLYSMIDAIIVGKYVGTEALAGVGSTGAINFFVLGFAMGLCNGFAIPIAQSFGANDTKRLKHFVAMSLYLCIASAIVITGISVFALEPLLEMMNTPTEIFGYAYDYMIIILMGIFASIAYNMTAGILRSLGDSRTPLYFLILAALLNIVLDLLFILKFDMGVAGAGLATVISQGVSAVLCIIYMYKKFPILKLAKEDFAYSQASINRLLRIGLPMAFQFTIIASGSIILQSAVNTLGTVYIASYAICCKIEQLAIQPFVTLGVAATTFTAQNLGAGKIDRIKDGMKKILMIGIILSISAGLLIYGFNKPLIELFMTEADSNALVIQHSKQYLGWVCLSLPPLMVLILYRAAIQGLGDILAPTIAGIVELVARVAVGAGLASSIGFLAICLACPVAWFGSAALIVPAYIAKVKKLEKTMIAT